MISFGYQEKIISKMFTIEFDNLLPDSYPVRYLWDCNVHVAYVLRKIHTYSSLISEMGNWSLPETSPSNLGEFPSIMLLQGVFIVANENMHKLDFILTTSYPSTEDRDLFEIKFKAGFQHFDDLTTLLLRIENDTIAENDINPWLNPEDFKEWEEKVLERLGIDERVKRLTRRVYEFNQGVDSLGEFLKERDEINENEEQEEEDEDSEQMGEEEKDDFDKERENPGEEFEWLDKLEEEKDDLGKERDSRDEEVEERDDLDKERDNPDEEVEEKDSLDKERDHPDQEFEWLDKLLNKWFETGKLERPETKDKVTE